MYPPAGWFRPKYLACEKEPHIRDARTNRRIRAREVRVIGAQGEQLGVLSIEGALAKAVEAGLDLVEISPTAKPPVCKIMDYGKFKYDEKKRQAQAKKKQVVVQIKEIKLRPRTDAHDYDFKLRNVRRFLEEGNKAKLTIMFRGREIVHKELGQKLLMKVIDELKDVGVVEQSLRTEGKLMFMVLAPNPKWKGKQSTPAGGPSVSVKIPLGGVAPAMNPGNGRLATTPVTPPAPLAAAPAADTRTSR